MLDNTAAKHEEIFAWVSGSTRSKDRWWIHAATKKMVANEESTMSNRIALTEQQKAWLFDRLIERDVLRWRVGPREVRGEMVDRTYIEHGATKEMSAVEK
jgi:hypothetical protein